MTKRRYLVPLKRTSTETQFTTATVLAESEAEAIDAAMSAAERDRDIEGVMFWSSGDGPGGYEVDLDTSEEIEIDDVPKASLAPPPSYDDLQRSIIELLNLISLADGETRNDEAVREARALLDRIPIE